MSELRLYAISIDEIRDMFGADEQRAAQLREIAASSLEPIAEAPQRGLLGKLGPIFRRTPGEAPIDPHRPRASDLDDQIAGRFPEADRLVARWRLLEVLVAGVAWSSTRIALPGTLLKDIDFALAYADVPTSLSLANLLDDDLRVGLPAVPGLRVGFCHHPRAVARSAAYTRAAPQVAYPEQAELIAGLGAWLSGFHRWGELAPDLGRPVPDLVGFCTG